MPMAKTKTQFVCSNCGFVSPKWLGKCPSCQMWNTLQEEILPSGKSKVTARTKSKAHKIALINPERIARISTQDPEFDRVLGGGLVPGSVTLVGGQPGIGKSTLLLQTALQWKQGAIYVSGEESIEQIKLRADRIGSDPSDLLLLTEVTIEYILAEIRHHEVDLVVIDSIQTMQSAALESAPGSISQVRDCTALLQRFAKENGISVIIIGHITKEGSLAGPKILEHIVDTVLQFEGDQHHHYRILRTHKNRFGSTDELGIYEMRGTGMSPVENPFKLFIPQESLAVSGSAIAATMEGRRTLLVEVQALVGAAVYGTPQRSTTGFDLRRLHMLLAVLEKRSGLFFGQMDVFLNIAGGLRVTDPALDLAVLIALVSSLEDLTVPGKTCFAGEVSLAGEIRPVQRLDQRIQEAGRLGFERIYVSAQQQQAAGLANAETSLQVISVATTAELYDVVFG